QFGTHIHDGAHEEASRAAARNGEVRRGRPFRGGQKLGARDEIRERVPLFHHAPLVVPAFPKIAPTPDMGESAHDTAVEQTQPRCAETHGIWEAIRTITFEEQRRLAVANKPFPMN